MSKLATILGPVGSKHRRLVACLLAFIVSIPMGIILHRLLFALSIGAIVSVNFYFFSSVGRLEQNGRQRR
jgi:hypothetical protein